VQPRGRLRRGSILVRPLVLAAVFGAAVGCADGGTQPPDDRVATLEVEPGTVTVEAGKSVQITATARTSRGVVVERDIIWNSSDAAVARVSSTGLVTGVMPGAADVTASVDGRQAKAVVTVTEVPVETVEVMPPAATIDVGESVQLQAVAKAADGTVLTNRVPVWTSSATGTARVSTTGLVTGVAAGNAAITASVGGRSGAAAIRVVQPLAAQLIDAGGDFTCAILSTILNCWGQGGSGQLGNAAAQVRAALAPVASTAQFVWISTGRDAACGSTVTLEIYCWGAGASGQIGDGNTLQRNSPTRVASALAFSSVETGTRFACALTTVGTAHCWGENTAGQLGDGSATNRTVPGPVSGGLLFASLTAGGSHACGLTTAGAAFCWGAGASGQLGDGLSASANTPVTVAGAHVFSAITAGDAHTCAITAAGEAYCWGLDDVGQLGDGGTLSSATPIRIGGTRSYRAIAAGAAHTCAVTTDGEVWCWGLGTSGQLGDGSLSSRGSPGVVAPASASASSASSRA